MSDVGHVGVGGLEELMVWRSTWEEYVGGDGLEEYVGGVRGRSLREKLVGGGLVWSCGWWSVFGICGRVFGRSCGFGERVVEDMWLVGVF